MAGQDRTGQEYHFRVPGAMTWNKTASSAALFLTVFSPQCKSPHVHLFSF